MNTNLEIMNLSVFGIVVIAMLFLVLVIKLALEQHSFGKYLENRNKILKDKFRITEDLW